MNDNYAVINGKRIELTDEQVIALWIKTRKNPFERLAKYSSYYRVTDANQVDDYVETFDSTDNRLYDVANYFNDKTFANQVALHQLLYRKLLKFAYDNECEDTAEWNGDNEHWCFEYLYGTKCFSVYPHYSGKSQIVYFSSKEAAEQAIREVVEPFMKEHPEFIW